MKDKKERLQYLGIYVFGLFLMLMLANAITADGYEYDRMNVFIRLVLLWTVTAVISPIITYVWKRCEHRKKVEIG